jgi:hypothetical protein
VRVESYSQINHLDWQKREAMVMPDGESKASDLE